MEKNSNKFNSFKFEPNDIQKTVIRNFLKNKINDNSILVKIKNYENFINKNFKKGSVDYNHLMAFFSLTKWLSYKYIYLDVNQNSGIYSREYACGHRGCFDCCMYTNLNEYNLVDWVGVVASGGQSLGWQTASCQWDCW